MTTFDCALNGVSLSGLDERICVLDLREDAPKLRTAAALLRPEGQLLLAQSRESLTVHIRFAIHEEQPPRRSEVLSRVRAWAEKGGTLTLSSREGQRLQVICTAMPALSAEDWLQEMSITLTSVGSPYWEATAVTEAATFDEATLLLPGTADSAPVDVLVSNASEETVTSLHVSCGTTALHFEGLALEAGSEVLIEHLSGLLTARTADDSVLKYRTAESSDQLLAPCGASCSLRVWADQTVHARFYARGRYA